jgi:hypothetical protein
MRDWLVFGFVLLMAAGGALSLANRDPGGRLVACASLSEGSWFAGEYCGPGIPGSPSRELASNEELAELAAR